LWFVKGGLAHLFGIHVGAKGRHNYATSLLEHGNFLNKMLLDLDKTQEDAAHE
jgi:hypothetical protein